MFDRVQNTSKFQKLVQSCKDYYPENHANFWVSSGQTVLLAPSYYCLYHKDPTTYTCAYFLWTVDMNRYDNVADAIT